MSAVEVSGVTRRFGAVVALDDVSLEVGHGELVGMLGPNGAGKSTLLSLVSGQRKPDSGVVRLDGRDPRDARARTVLGLTPQETGLPATLRVREVVDFVGGHYPDPVPTDELLEQFGLADLGKRQTGSLSGGQKRRLAVAMSLVGRPSVVLLDEPTTGLDVSGRTALWDAIREYHAGGGTVLLTSHYLEEVQALAERVVVIDRGSVLADDSLQTVLSRVGLRRVLFTARTGTPDGWERQEHLVPDSDTFVRELVTSGTEFRDLEIRGASLEEAFGQLVGDADGAGRAPRDTAATPTPALPGMTEGAAR
ncbi:ABC transporter ATP-binding protein [Promicromonospora vindobonensis]|uniref:ABC transporter ATP-binding protein n=1 Tax=Promicromonospora vindobonensis TaxID=195748 RepID=A0ABW5VV55_9MICO